MKLFRKRGFQSHSSFDKRQVKQNASSRKESKRKLTLECLENRRVFAAAVLNEISVDPNGGDQPWEYVEIKGIPGAPATDLYFVSVEGDNPVSGTADLVFDLTGLNFGSNGLIAVVADTFAGYSSIIPPETTQLLTEAFISGTGQTLENGTNTFAIIQSPTPILAGYDFDPLNDGSFILPEGATLVDSIGWSDGGATDIVYGGAVLTQPVGGTPGAATRFLNDNRANEAAAWYNGDLQSPVGSVFYQEAPNQSLNFPVGGQLTPGAPNVPGTNSAPAGVADSYSVEPFATLSAPAGAGVLSNDTDPDGLQSVLFAQLVSGPTLGTLIFNSDGSFEYTSNGTEGVDSFTYRATDLSLFSSVVTVTLNVEVNDNIAPTLTLPMGPFAFTEGSSSVAISSGATVVDSDSADFSIGFLSVAILANGEPEDSLSVLSEGTGAGQISVASGVVQYEGITIGSVMEGTATSPLLVNFNSNATLAAVQALVQNIRFSNSSQAPSSAPRTIEFIVNDGDGGQSVPQTLEVGIVPVNDAPVITQARSRATYAVGNGAVTLDGLIGLADIDSFDFDGGTITATIALNGTASDVLGIRSTGTGVGEVSVSGSNVSYEGSVVGTISGGISGTPLMVMFNATASSSAVRAVARAVTFDTADPRILPAAREVTLVVADGDGGSDVATYTVAQSLARSYAFQEGVDGGQGVYSGVEDVQLAQNQPDTVLPVGANPATEGLLVDFDGGSANSQVLLRFGDIFGTGAGQIPLGSQIVSARLVLDTNNPGDGGTFHRLLTGFDPNNETWNSFGNGASPRNATPGVQSDDAEARAAFESQIGVAAANSDPDAGVTVVGVTQDLQAWANGEENFGWMIQGWSGRTDGWAFSASESENPVDRPRLEIDWVPANVSTTSFRNGEGSYTEAADTALLEAFPEDDSSTLANIFVDWADAGSNNTSQVLLRFNSIIGNELAGRIPQGALIHSAVLDLSSTLSNAEGDGGTFNRMLTDWLDTFNWSTFGNGVQADNITASSVATTTAGDPALPRTQEAGFLNFDVTSDVQAWVSGDAPNFGWAILPYVNGTNGWGIETSEAENIANRPKLRVYYTPAGVTVSPTSDLETTELGGTTQFSVVLNTPPTDTVTIGISSSDTSEGTVSSSSIVFTPENWDIPQIVTITGVNDADLDGDVAYQIITGPAMSSDVNYSGFDAADVDVTNIDDDSSSATPATVAGVTFGDGTSQRSMVKSIRVDFSTVVTADPGAFVLERRVNGAFEAIPASELAISFTDIGSAQQSQFLLTFSGSTVIGGSLADGNYRLTVLADSVQANGLDLDGDNDGEAGGNFVRGNDSTDQFFRLFGDFNGLGGVNALDINVFRSSIGTNNPVFDFNSIGGVNAIDINAFRQRIGKNRGF